MNTSRLRTILGPLYQKTDAAHGLDHAERLERLAMQWRDELEDPMQVDADILEVLALLVPVRELARSVATRAGIEACFAEAGWTAVRSRETLRSLERLPDRPKTLEEKLIADADTVCRLGVLGFARQIVIGTTEGTSLREAPDAMRKNLARRIHTRPAQRASTQPREQLRELSKQLRGELEG